MKKKILSIALALCLILTMMPMATGVAWADVTVSISNATYYGSGALQKSKEVLPEILQAPKASWF